MTSSVAGSILGYFANRLSEPSTYAGIGVIVAAVQRRDYGSAIMAGLGILGVVLPEKKG